MNQPIPTSHRRGATRIAALLLACAASSCGGADPSPAEPPEAPAQPSVAVPPSLAGQARAVEARGRQLAQYEEASVAAGIALRGRSPDPSLFDTYLAVQDGASWHVYFGKLAADLGSFETAYAFDCAMGRCAPGAPPADPAAVAPLAAAIRTAGGSFTPKADAYNASVFAETNGTISVYVVPGNTDPEVVLLGGDYRISVSGDGKEIIKVIELHKTVLEFPSRVPEGIEAFGTVRTNAIGELPAGTDVSFIIRNPHLAPHTVIGPRWTARISASGALTVLGETEAVLAAGAVTAP